MITVEISKQRLSDLGSDIHAGLHILRALCGAGIPVVGTLFPMGVTDGTLTMTDDTIADKVVYAWDGEEGLA